ncbi:MAG: M50 family metallopeptidase, partial [Clostridia bacterium]
MTFLYILLAIVLLGVLIVVHEMGHFWASRACGIAVKEFSVGFGPKLVQWKSKKHETVFSIRPIPLGGYCMFYGEAGDGQPTDQADPRNYNNAPVWKRMISVVCGPLMNMILAFVVAIARMSFYGVSITTPLIASVDAGAPAQVAGLEAGDVFVRVRGEDMTGRTVQDVSGASGAVTDDKPIEVVVNRNGEEKNFQIVPKYDTAESRYRIGIMIQQGYTDLPAGQVIPSAWSTCVEASGAILNALGKMFTTGEGLDQTAGPVGVVQLVAQQTQQGGMEIFLYLTVMISINLGLVNLLPIPGLDGSRLVFMLVEAIRRKPVSQRIEGAVHMCGYVLLFGIMLFFTFKDVMRL